MRGEELPPVKKNGSATQPKEEELPEHVKTLLEEKKKREQENSFDANA
jgi:hypothetical protein